MSNRSSIEFPFTLDITGYLEKAWKEGWLDEFSEDHFLIKALNNKLTNIDWASQLINNNTTSFNTPITHNGDVDFNTFSKNFILNLSAKLKNMSNVLGEAEIKNFIINQLSAGKSSYNQDSFFQALSEIEILSFYCAKTYWHKAIYEPSTDKNGSNPEARFVWKGHNDKNYITVNVEVKTPQFPIVHPQTTKTAIPAVLLTDAGREKAQKLCSENDIKCILPRVTKLVDFINSATKKFEFPKDNEYNFLYINWSYSDFSSNGFLEAWSLLANEVNGVLTHPEIGTRLPYKKPINADAYKKITAIIVYTSSLEQLMFSDFRYSWQGSIDVGPRFRMFILDKKKQENDSDIIFKISGMNPSSLKPQKWMMLFDPCWSNNTTIEYKAKDCKFHMDMLNIINENLLTLEYLENN